jgi:hypothetical protein
VDRWASGAADAACATPATYDDVAAAVGDRRGRDEAEGAGELCRALARRAGPVAEVLRVGRRLARRLGRGERRALRRLDLLRHLGGERLRLLAADLRDARQRLLELVEPRDDVDACYRV